MNINATILVQAVNFFIAYLILRVLLLRPSVDAIEQERIYHDELDNAIARGQHAVQEVSAIQSKQWRSCSAYFEQNKPRVDYPERYLFRHITPTVMYPVPTKAQEKKLVDQAHDDLIKSIRQRYAHK